MIPPAPPDTFAILPWQDDPVWEPVPHTGEYHAVMQPPPLFNFANDGTEAPIVEPLIHLTAHHFISPRDRWTSQYEWIFYARSDAELRRGVSSLLVAFLATRLLHWIASLA